MASVSTWLPSARPRWKSDAQLPSGLLVFLLALLVLAALCAHMLGNGYQGSEALARYARVLIMRDASKLYIEDVGFLSPQVSPYLTLLLSSIPGITLTRVPYLLDIMLASLFVTLVWRDLNKSHGLIFATLWTALLAAHPFFLWTALSGQDLALGLLCFYGLSRSLRRFRNDPEVFSYLRFAGWLCLLFFVDTRAMFIAVALAPWLVLIAPPSLLHRAPLAFYLVCYVPFLFAVLGWAYLNWLFFNDALIFLKQTGSAFRGGFESTPYLPWLLEFGGTWWVPLIWLTGAGVMAFPSLVLTPWNVQPRGWVGPVVTAGVVVCAGAMATLVWYTSEPVEFLALLLAAAALGLREMQRQRTVVTALLLAGIPLGWLVMHQMPSQDMEPWTQSLRERVPAPITDEALVGVWLADSSLPTLIDDQTGYAVIAARGNGRNLILPFSDSYKMAMATPSRMPAQIVVAKPGSQQAMEDASNLHFPGLWAHGRPGYQLAYERGAWRVWQKEDLSRWQ